MSIRKRGLRCIAGFMGCVAVLGLAAYLGISLFTADRLTRATTHPLLIDPTRVSRDARAWTARTSDGLTLRGWYLPTAERRHLIVLVHGMWSSWVEMAALGRDLHSAGYDVLLFDLRGHGQSDATRLTLGRRERGDLRAVMSWAAAEGFSRDRIGWLGYSMGASTLLFEAAQNADIRVAVMDSPYGDLPDILRVQLSKHSNLPSWFNPGILAAARWIFGVRTDDLIPIRAARSWGNRPLLLIHGESDSIVPLSQAYQLAGAAGSTCLTTTLPGVEHVGAYDADPEGYVSLIQSFFASHLSP
ncbi:alpha/beta hydrolase [Aquisphaera insulae]|uniref:alpha/beta hydrolase n=1 Tax=Aquisphaera insulae TaxID=2712864 RepID=UPI0013EC0490|nr:alpha/beta fold hydrolase [Aquisphaera insulae]